MASTPSFHDWTAAGGSPAGYTDLLKELNLGKQLELQSLDARRDGGFDDFNLFDFGKTTDGGSLDPSPRDGQGASLSQPSDAGEEARFFDAEQGALTPSDASRAREGEEGGEEEEEEDDEEDDEEGDEEDDEEEGNSEGSREDNYLLGGDDDDDDEDYDDDEEEEECGVCNGERHEHDGMCDKMWFDVVDWEDRLDGANEFIIVPNIQTRYVETGTRRREKELVEGDPPTCIVWGDLVDAEGDFSEDSRYGPREDYLARVADLRAFIRANQGQLVTHEAFIAAVPDDEDRLFLTGMDGDVDVEPYDDEHNASAEQKAAFAEEMEADIEEEQNDEAEAMRGALSEIEEHFSSCGVPFPHAQAKADGFAKDASLDTLRAAWDLAEAAYVETFEEPEEELDELADTCRDLHGVLDLLLHEVRATEAGADAAAVMTAQAVVDALAAAAEVPSWDRDGALPERVQDYPARAAELRAVVDALRQGVAHLAGSSRKRKRKALEGLAVAEIRAEQRSTGLVIDPRNFELLVREMGQDFKTDLHFEKEALEALQTAAEGFLVEVFDKANGLAVLVGGREKLRPEDLRRAWRDMCEYVHPPMH